jgi:hypothetical protein
MSWSHPGIKLSLIDKNKNTYTRKENERNMDRHRHNKETSDNYCPQKELSIEREVYAQRQRQYILW